MDRSGGNNSAATLNFEIVCIDFETVLVRLLSYLSVQEAVRLSATGSRRLRAVVKDNLWSESAIANIALKRDNAYIAMGDEMVWQRKNPHTGTVDFTSLIDKDLVLGWSQRGNVSECLGPTGEMDALDVSQVGQVVFLPQPIDLGLQWTICAWTLFRDCRPYRHGFVQPEGWIENEHALVGGLADDQQIFYSEGRGNWLGCYCHDIEEAEYEEDLNHSSYDDGFFSSQYSFRYSNISDGWHHIAAVGSKWRLGMGWNATPANGNGSTRYYVDGEHVGTTPFNLQAGVKAIGNVSGIDLEVLEEEDSDEEEELKTQPWGKVADFRIYRRSLSTKEIRLLLVQPVPTTEELFEG